MHFTPDLLIIRFISGGMIFLGFRCIRGLKRGPRDPKGEPKGRLENIKNRSRKITRPILDRHWDILGPKYHPS